MSRAVHPMFLLVVACILIGCPSCNCDGIWSYFTDLFNMHKIQPVREYTLYGPGNQKAHVNVDPVLPEIKPPKDIEISQAMRDEIMANRERLRESQAALAASQNNVSPPFPKSGSQPPKYPKYLPHKALNPNMRRSPLSRNA